MLLLFLATLFTDGAITAATAESVQREGNAPPDCRSALSIDTEPHAVNLHSIPHLRGMSNMKTIPNLVVVLPSQSPPPPPRHLFKCDE